MLKIELKNNFATCCLQLGVKTWKNEETNLTNNLEKFIVKCNVENKENKGFQRFPESFQVTWHWNNYTVWIIDSNWHNLKLTIPAHLKDTRFSNPVKG